MILSPCDSPCKPPARPRTRSRRSARTRRRDSRNDGRRRPWWRQTCARHAQRPWKTGIEHDTLPALPLHPAQKHQGVRIVKESTTRREELLRPSRGRHTATHTGAARLSAPHRLTVQAAHSFLQTEKNENEILCQLQTATGWASDFTSSNKSFCESCDPALRSAARLLY